MCVFTRLGNRPLPPSALRLHHISVVSCLLLSPLSLRFMHLSVGRRPHGALCCVTDAFTERHPRFHSEGRTVKKGGKKGKILERKFFLSWSISILSSFSLSAAPISVFKYILPLFFFVISSSSSPQGVTK